VKQDRFHGRVGSSGRGCDWPACDEYGEFRAPGGRAPGFDGPGDYRWFCLDHVRQFNAGYDYFAGMSPEQIWNAQSPLHGWEPENRAFRDAASGPTPRWADFRDPIEAMRDHIRSRVRNPADFRATTAGPPLSPEERRAFDVLGLAPGADRRALRGRYADLVRRYHPDRNGGDRSLEHRLVGVVEAYQLLRKSAVFS
jgi:hypothetical protein